MSLGSDTSVVNGQRVSTPVQSQYSPLSYGVQTTSVPNVSPTIPPYLGGSAGGASASGAVEGVGGYGTAGNNAQATQLAASNPWNAKVSPVWWAIGALVVGISLLRAIHWRRTTLEGASERAEAGPVREQASESA